MQRPWGPGRHYADDTHDLPAPAQRADATIVALRGQRQMSKPATPGGQL